MSEGQRSSMGWLRWESVAEQTRLKREAETQWSGLKRFGKLLYLKKENRLLLRCRFKEGKPRSQTNTQTSKFICSCWSKKTNQNNHGGHICMILTAALICVLIVFSLTALLLHYVQQCVGVNSNVWHHKWEHFPAWDIAAGFCQRASGRGYSK